MKFIQYSLLAPLLFGLAFGQQVRLSYELETTEEGTRVLVFGESYNDESVDLAALNLSFAFNEGCEVSGATESMLLETWTDYLAKQVEGGELELNHGDNTFTHRLQWGSADPGLPQTSEVILAPKGKSTLLLTQTFKGACQDVYLEHESENPLNELGDPKMNPLSYVISHPQRPVAEVFDLEVDVFPNPTTDYVTLKAKSLDPGTYSFRLTDIQGRLVKTTTRTLLAGDDVSVTFDIQREAAGMYILDFFSEEEPQRAQAHKILKE